MRKEKRKFRIRTQVMLGFAVFAVSILALLWVFQITLLNTFYKAIKTQEIRQLSDQVVEMMDSGAGAQDFLEVTRTTNVSILIAGQDGSNIFLSSTKGDVLEQLNREECARLFAATKAEGGYILEESVLPETTFSRRQNGGQNILLLYAHTATLSDGEEYVLVLSGSIVPVDATVETLKIQLWCVTGVMILLSFVLALGISKKLSKPLEQINHSAKDLAKGTYHIRFPETGAKEVAELAATLNYAAEELSKVEDLRRELIANVSHDLRTPLTMISGYAEVMRDLPGENTPENVQIILDESNRLTGLVNDMLDLSKLQAGVQELRLETFDLTAEIEAIRKRYDKLVDFQFPFAYTRHVWVCADRLKFSQVLYNLVNNAVNYAGQDKTVYLRQTVSADDTVVRVEITDTGEGIPADKLPHIWDRYYKVDKAHRRAQVGTGLGLSIVRNILDMHGGRYGVVSTPGQGSTFWFELPCAPQSTEA